MPVSVKGSGERLHIRPNGLIQPAQIQILLQPVSSLQVILLALRIQKVILQLLLRIDRHNLPAFGPGCSDTVSGVTNGAGHYQAGSPGNQIFDMFLPLRFSM